jgi:hypothetical protein
VVEIFSSKIPMNRAKSSLIVVNPPLASGRANSARRAEMLRVVAPYVVEMLHLKSLTINLVAGVAGFYTISHIWAIPTPTTGSVSVWTKIIPRTLLKLKQRLGIEDASPKHLTPVRTTRSSGAIANPIAIHHPRLNGCIDSNDPERPWGKHPMAAADMRGYYSYYEQD